MTAAQLGGYHWHKACVDAGLIDLSNDRKHHHKYTRHTAASRWRADGVDSDDVRVWMGHTSYEFTRENYVHKSSTTSGRSRRCSGRPIACFTCSAGLAWRCPCHHRASCCRAAGVEALCDWWAIPLEQTRDLLEQAYLETLTPEEARQRERCSIRGVWDWLERRN